SARAANAMATPWLPPEAAVTPAGGTCRSSRLAKAPRTLNEPECCSISSLSTSRIGARPKSAPSTATTGVSRTWSQMRAKACEIDARSTVTASMDLILAAGRPPGHPLRPVSSILTLIRHLANCKYAYPRCRQGGGERPQAPDPPLAEEAARAFRPPGRRRPRARRRVRPADRQEARREPADRERAPQGAHP